MVEKVTSHAGNVWYPSSNSRRSGTSSNMAPITARQGTRVFGCEQEAGIERKASETGGSTGNVQGDQGIILSTCFCHRVLLLTDTDLQISHRLFILLTMSACGGRCIECVVKQCSLIHSCLKCLISISGTLMSQLQINSLN